MACAVQRQFCNPSLPEGSRCTPLGGYSDTVDEFLALYRDASEADCNRAAWAYDLAFGSMGIDSVVSILGSQSLTARDSLSVGNQGPLPDNQWQLEVQHWHETSLAYTQSLFITTAAGPNDRRIQEWVVKPNNTQEVQLCGSQVCKIPHVPVWVSLK